MPRASGNYAYDNRAQPGLRADLREKPRMSLTMRVVHQAAALIEHKPIEGEFDVIRLLDDIEFQRVRASHLARRPMPAQLDNTGVTLVLALIGAPGCFVAGLFINDVAYFFGAAFWAIAGIAMYTYLAHAAKYWREYSAIRVEEVRRFGRSSFG